MTQTTFALPFRRLLMVIIGLATPLGLASCAANEPHVVLKGQRYSIEVVSRFEDKQLGLMFRTEMDADHGMLFVYDREEPQSFWMKNTKIPLDILYFDSEQRLINGHYNVPPCRRDPCKSYPSDDKAQYVLELNGGVAQALNLAKGDPLEIHY